MEKEAFAAKKLLKILAKGTVGAAAVGGAGYAGHRIGVKRTANAMASAFTEANQRENMGIRNSFNAFNQKENAAIANSYLRKGMVLGANLHAKGKIRLPSEMSKKASLSAIYDEAFRKELEKDAFFAGAIKAGAKVLGKSFRRLSRGAKSINARSNQLTGQTAAGKSHIYKRMGETATRTLKGGAPAIAATGVAGTAGYAALT